MFYVMSDCKVRGFEHVNENFRKEGIGTLPVRSTRNSAGYDFFSPIDIEIPPKNKVTLWTNIKAYMQPQEVLMLYIRSSVGIKKGLTLANGTGIIDSDYYGNEDNDGNIGICLYNHTFMPVVVKAGERIAQGIFMLYLVADQGNTETLRQGGIGSSN